MGSGKQKALYQKIIEHICEEAIPKTYLNFILRGIERIFDHFGKQVAESDMTEEDVVFLLFLFGFTCLQGVEIVEGV